MTSKKFDCPKAVKILCVHSTYSLSEFKNVSPIIDADGLQIARLNRSRPTAYTEIILA